MVAAPTQTITDYPLPPRIPGLPFLGHGLSMRGHVAKFFVQLYQEHGEIVRIPILNEDYTALMGADANRWFVKNQHLFSNQEIYAMQAEAWQAPFFIIAADGDVHKMARRAVRPAQSVSMLESRLEDAVKLAAAEAKSWQVGESFSIWDMLQHLITDQIGIVTANIDSGKYYEDLRRFFVWTTSMDLAKTFPKWFQHLPQFKNTMRRLTQLANELIEEHRQNPPETREHRTIVDDLLEEQAQNPDMWTQEALVAATVGPFFAGMDTVASTMSFLFYLILKHPDVYGQIQQEIADAYADGTPLTREKLENMRVLNGTVHETLRMYPIGAATPRIVVEDCEYKGYRIEKGTKIYLGNSVPHFLEEYYPEPDKFDPMRPMKPPAPFTFTPFSLGKHTCLGAGFARLQILLNATVLLRHATLELDPLDYMVKPQAAPVPNTGYDLKAKVIAKH